MLRHPPRHPPAPPGSGRQVCKEGHGRAPGFCSEDYYAAWNKSFPLSGTRILHLQEERVGLGILKSLPELRVGQPTLFLLFFFYVIYQTSLLECWYFTNSQGVFVSASCRQQTAAYQPQNPGGIRNITVTAHTLNGQAGSSAMCRPAGGSLWAAGPGTSVGQCCPRVSPPPPLVDQQPRPGMSFPGREQEGQRKRARSPEVQAGNCALPLSPYSIGQSKSHDESQTHEIRT